VEDLEADPGRVEHRDPPLETPVSGSPPPYEANPENPHPSAGRRSTFSSVFSFFSSEKRKVPTYISHVTNEKSLDWKRAGKALDERRKAKKGSHQKEKYIAMLLMA
jgi:hypothetical protein